MPEDEWEDYSNKFDELKGYIEQQSK